MPNCPNLAAGPPSPLVGEGREGGPPQADPRIAQRPAPPDQLRRNADN
jgi:hypothetical protein